jgi:hypothetical protein
LDPTVNQKKNWGVTAEMVRLARDVAPRQPYTYDQQGRPPTREQPPRWLKPNDANWNPPTYIRCCTLSARTPFMMDSPLMRVNSTLAFDHFKDKADIRERKWAGKTDFDKFACAAMPMSPRMKTRVHLTRLPAGPGDSMLGPSCDSFEASGPLSPIAYFASPARLTPRPRATGDLSASTADYTDSPDWQYHDFEAQIIKNLNMTLQVRPWTNPSYRSPRQYAVAKTWGVDGTTGAGSPVLREEKTSLLPPPPLPSPSESGQKVPQPRIGSPRGLGLTDFVWACATDFVWVFVLC